MQVGRAVVQKKRCDGVIGEMGLVQSRGLWRLAYSDNQRENSSAVWWSPIRPLLLFQIAYLAITSSSFFLTSVPLPCRPPLFRALADRLKLPRQASSILQNRAMQDMLSCVPNPPALRRLEHWLSFRLAASMETDQRKRERG